LTFPGRQRELLERLVSEKVRFVLVGGHAVGAWGHIRATDDVDLVPDPDPENLWQLAKVLEGVGGRVEVAGERMGREALSVFLRAGDKALVVTDLGVVDVLQGLPQIPRYDELEAEAHDAEMGDLKVRVCSLEHLRAMKRASDRPLDKDDLEALGAAHPELEAE
jgi:predicted nucleotidyltransferase